jgi:hypothetical protein
MKMTLAERQVGHITVAGCIQQTAGDCNGYRTAMNELAPVSCFKHDSHDSCH